MPAFSPLLGAGTRKTFSSILTALGDSATRLESVWLILEERIRGSGVVGELRVTAMAFTCPVQICDISTTDATKMYFVAGGF